MVTYDSQQSAELLSQDVYGYNNTIKEIFEGNINIIQRANPALSFEEQMELAEEWTSDDIFFSLHDLIFKKKVKHLNDIIQPRIT